MTPSDLKVALLLGGPSEERGISLNSARSVADHLEGDGVAIEPIVYFDAARRPYLIDRKMLYSNTPSDFDFKLSRIATPLSEDALAAALGRSHLAFPALHGAFGEDGELQSLLERIGVPYVGSAPEACRVAYDKFLAHEALRAAGIETVPSLRYSSAGPGEGEGTAEDGRAVEAAARVVVKPAAGGSSLGVSVFAAADRAAGIEAAVAQHGVVVAQPFVDGVEFTTVVVEGADGPVALLPVEVELRRTSPDEIFSFRHKYLASDDSRYHCPPRQDDEVVAAIRAKAEATFRALRLRDFARIDCWLDPTGRVLVSDVNPISGMEQNSFLFIQAAEIGMTHADVLRLVLAAACRRAGLAAPVDRWRAADARPGRVPIPVLFGGETAERHVSLLSGTNVWMKLMRSARFEPAAYLLEDRDTVWQLPYPMALRHSVDQIVETCRAATAVEDRRRRLADDVAGRLGLEPWQVNVGDQLPRRMTMDEFLSDAPFVFIALHGGFGEDGTLQAELERRGIPYNGSDPDASAVCMDKYETGLRLAGLEADGITTARKVRLSLLDDRLDDQDSLWEDLARQCRTSTLMVKPLADGCSAGVVPLTSPGELRAYVDALRSGARRLDKGRFAALAGDQVVELPVTPTDLLFEEFVATDDVAVVDGGPEDGAGAEPARLRWAEERDTGWIEVTVGVLGTAGAMEALSPSLTIARKGVLSVEEKFMGGTGVNITPPPSPPLGRVEPGAVARTRRLIRHVAHLLGVRGYARIDAFMNRETGDVIVIEANSLPGLTASTVLYHQALEESPPLYPRALLERIIDLGFEARAGAQAVPAAAPAEAQAGG